MRDAYRRAFDALKTNLLKELKVNIFLIKFRSYVDPKFP